MQKSQSLVIFMFSNPASKKCADRCRASITQMLSPAGIRPKCHARIRFAQARATISISDGSRRSKVTKE